MRFVSGKKAAAVAATLGAAVMFAPNAYADSGASTSTSTSTLATIKAKAAAAISLRDSALNSAISAVSANRYLTSADRATVLNTLTSDQAGLNALAPVIQGDTTVAQARTDYETIFTHYRVFALALPQARFAAAADDLTGTVLPHLTDAQSRLEALLSGPGKSKDTPAVQAAMTDLGNRISAITTSTNGLAATVLAFTPAQYDANPGILSGPRSQLVTARGDARTAHHDIQTVVEVLK